MSLQLDNILITGRTIEEYMAFFDLKIKDLENKKVLDCPSGVSSFISEAKKYNIDAKGCDIIYQFAKEDINTQGEKSIEIIYADTTWMKDFNFDFYKSIENHKRYRQRALQKFHEDFNTHDYSFQTLPTLDYKNKEFDLLLSSHLLFVYDDRFDYEFHKNSIKEMLRVAKEVRLFPLVDYKNSRVSDINNFSPYVYDIVKEFGAEIIKVDFEFQNRANYMMRITS